jgi:alpha-beta hydrolase superfamily lysophospholipase
MIAMPDELSTMTHARLPRRAVLLGPAALLGGCVSMAAPPGPVMSLPRMDGEAFVMRDGARLPVRAWLPMGEPVAVVLALHGFNDSRDAWEIPAPTFAAAGLAVYAPDQRGFGDAPGRGLWPGTAGLVDDAADMVKALRALHRGQKLFLMGESMGGAVLMCLATTPNAPKVDGYVLVAPAVWGRQRMNVFMRVGLWLAATVVPGMEVSRPPPMMKIYASDNAEAIRRLSRNPLTIKATRFDTLRGLVNLMDAALAAAPTFKANGLFLYGRKDEIVPPEATRATWSALHGERLALYANGWHLLLRDLDRALPISDIIAWIGDSRPPLPSGAEERAAAWLASG